jgi:hypothetical protein
LPPTLIKQFIKKFKTKYGYNTKEIQDLGSDLCGWYCLGLAFTVYRLYNHPNISLIQRTNNFINIFTSNTGENADILKNLL